MSSTLDPKELIGSDVLAVGRRQAWLFITFGDPRPERTECTLWIDTSFRIGQEHLSPLSAALAHLEPLVAAYVEDANVDADGLHLRFDTAPALDVSSVADHPESGIWWLVQSE